MAQQAVSLLPTPCDQACPYLLCPLDLLLSHPGGHYIAYCQNVINGQWYEFDDQYVTEVHETVVQNAEAYVLFYRWAQMALGAVLLLASVEGPGVRHPGTL
jgi:hypothetical protein